MGKRYKDFDAFWGEQKRIPLTVKIFGKHYTLPPALPASIMLYTLRAQASGQNVVGPEVVIKMAEGLFGKKQLEAIVEEGLDTEQLGDVIKYCTEMYQGGSGGDEEETPTAALAVETTGADSSSTGT